MSAVAEAIDAGTVPDRVWIYPNYHCNLDSAYCLTESAPRAPKRLIGSETMVAIAREAAELGFAEVGITGGEPFLRRDIVDTIGAMCDHLPVTVLTNGTQFEGDRLDRLDPLVGRNVRFQISLDSPDPDLNDEFRAPGNFAKVVEAVPRMVEKGHRVRIATTVEEDRLDPERHDRLCRLHRSWGIDDDDHLVRPVVRRGRAVESGLGRRFERDELPPELTIAAHGAFWSPFGPTVTAGRADTHLMITRAIQPLAVPAEALVSLLEGRPPGADAQIGIR